MKKIYLLILAAFAVFLSQNSLAQASIGEAYPNPFRDKVTVEIPATENDFVTLAVYDVLGNEVYKLNLVTYKQNGVINIEPGADKKLENGVYFLKVACGEQVKTYRLIHRD